LCTFLGAVKYLTVKGNRYRETQESESQAESGNNDSYGTWFFPNIGPFFKIFEMEEAYREN
jgi:hypothetical protein